MKHTAWKKRGPQENTEAGDLLITDPSLAASSDIMWCFLQSHLDELGPKASIWLWDRFSAQSQDKPRSSRAYRNRARSCLSPSGTMEDELCISFRWLFFFFKGKWPMFPKCMDFFLSRDRLIFTTSEKQPVYTFAGGFVWKNFIWHIWSRWACFVWLPVDI